MILIDSGGPVFFRQKRAGQDGQPFTMLKFRTMVPDAEERLEELVDLDEARRAGLQDPGRPAHDPRGRLLRRTSIDELPQLINVLARPT